tara:strand:- start:786 stop:932 length:147 start_codon:yes stop_codon:yes gene_type:complete
MEQSPDREQADKDKEVYLAYWLKFIEKWGHLPECPTEEYIRKEAEKEI